MKSKAQFLSIKDINNIRQISPKLFNLLKPIVSQKNQIIRNHRRRCLKKKSSSIGLLASLVAHGRPDYFLTTEMNQIEFFSTKYSREWKPIPEFFDTFRSLGSVLSNCFNFFFV